MSSELELWDSARSKQVLSPGPGDLWFRRGGNLVGNPGKTVTTTDATPSDDRIGR